MLGISGIEFPQRHVAAGARGCLRQRRAPRAAAEHRNALKSCVGHAAHSSLPRKRGRGGEGEVIRNSKLREEPPPDPPSLRCGGSTPPASGGGEESPGRARNLI